MCTMRFVYICWKISYLLFDDFSSIIMHQFKLFLLSKMKPMCKNDIQTEASEHTQDGEHGNTFTKPLSFVKYCISFEQG